MTQLCCSSNCNLLPKEALNAEFAYCVYSSAKAIRSGAQLQNLKFCVGVLPDLAWTRDTTTNVAMNNTDTRPPFLCDVCKLNFPRYGVAAPLSRLKYLRGRERAAVNGLLAIASAVPSSPSQTRLSLLSCSGCGLKACAHAKRVPEDLAATIKVVHHCIIEQCRKCGAMHCVDCATACWEKPVIVSSDIAAERIFGKQSGLSIADRCRLNDNYQLCFECEDHKRVNKAIPLRSCSNCTYTMCACDWELNCRWCPPCKAFHCNQDCVTMCRVTRNKQIGQIEDWRVCTICVRPCAKCACVLAVGPFFKVTERTSKRANKRPFDALGSCDVSEQRTRCADDKAHICR